MYTGRELGVTLASAIKLIEAGKLSKDESTVLCITGNGLKTQEALEGHTDKVHYIKPKLALFEEVLKDIEGK